MEYLKKEVEMGVLLIISILLIGIGYGESKTWGDRFRFTLVPISVAVSAVFIYFIIGCWEFNGIGNILKENLTSVFQLQIVFLFLVAYCLIALIAITFCAWKKEGFTNLKRVKEEGLIDGLIAGLILGLIPELIIGLIAGLILGLIVGPIVGLVVGLVVGFAGEYSRDN